MADEQAIDLLEKVDSGFTPEAIRVEEQRTPLIVEGIEVQEQILDSQATNNELSSSIEASTASSVEKLGLIAESSAEMQNDIKALVEDSTSSEEVVDAIDKLDKSLGEAVQPPAPVEPSDDEEEKPAKKGDKELAEKVFEGVANTLEGFSADPQTKEGISTALTSLIPGGRALDTAFGISERLTGVFDSIGEKAKEKAATGLSKVAGLFKRKPKEEEGVSVPAMEPDASTKDAIANLPEEQQTIAEKLNKRETRVEDRKEKRRDSLLVKRLSKGTQVAMAKVTAFGKKDVKVMLKSLKNIDKKSGKGRRGGGGLLGLAGLGAVIGPAIAVAVAGAVGTAIGSKLNEPLNNLAETLTGGKEKTLGGAIAAGAESVKTFFGLRPEEGELSDQEKEIAKLKGFEGESRAEFLTFLKERGESRSKEALLEKERADLELAKTKPTIVAPAPVKLPTTSLTPVDRRLRIDDTGLGVLNSAFMD